MVLEGNNCYNNGSVKSSKEINQSCGCIWKRIYFIQRDSKHFTINEGNKRKNAIFVVHIPVLHRLDNFLVNLWLSIISWEWNALHFDLNNNKDIRDNLSEKLNK